MKRAMGDGVEIQIAQWEGEDKAILCIHGITANCRCWDVIADALSPSHRVLAMDLRGRGLSGAPSSGYSMEHHCRDILAVLDDLGLERVVLMGHSLGAFISVVFGAKYPERVDSIILVDGGGKLSENQIVKVFSGIKPSLDRLGKVFPSFEAYLDFMKEAPFIKNWSQALETYYQYEVEEISGGVRTNINPDHIEEERVNLGKVDISLSYGKISCPVLILRATEGMLALDDVLLPEDVTQRMVREIANARRVDVNGTNHYSIIFQPHGERDQAIREFLRE
ncbi:MAG: alpha/beta hydrolase [Deltaproteobacteria bacterium]|uniref:Alpha/beta hydrolase n=1 Tax=Candidatus Desulfacyla euxinica TaxID=2841693 RepID=A0A8J6T5R0_9DELT|nr:alpha/beta hydrolase [Candidatus Desulfacyla euxinica]MBL7216451.1 alpha/beta hydrolase [Desulfobacteraceae bacterium]